MNRSLLTFFTLCLALPGAGLHGQGLPGSSPFLPAAAAAAGAPASTKYQLSGIMTNGPDLMVSITRLSDRQSFWIPVGGTVNEVTVLGCNPDRDEAVINASGEKLTLTLRKAATATGTDQPAVASAPPVVSPPLPPPVGSPEVQEREARMLVTDLLDIGQQHRKAYEEAQKKAAAEKK